jgi:SAM-dependent methyltransferase
MSIDRSRRTTFDEVADLYHEVRPGYPESLTDDILRLSAMPPQGRILEIGCGPGNATLPFAMRGYPMLCLELGPRLAAIARRSCQPYPQVHILNTAFEDWRLEASAFDLVISAEAFHWVPPEIAYPRAAAALKPGGSLALFWILSQNPDTALFRAIDQVYAEHDPPLQNPDHAVTPEWIEKQISSNIEASGYFDSITIQRYTWSICYDSEQYIKLLSTFSDHRKLAKDRRTKLFENLQVIIDRHGGSVERHNLAALFHTKLQK